MKSARFILFIKIAYFFILIFLGIYSFTQVDLNLTLSANPIFQAFQQPLLRLGYYLRPWSAGIFSALLLGLLICYIFFLYSAKHKLLSHRWIWKMIGLNSLLLFAYPAFSYDIFNYMFDARIVTQYHLSPYFFKALDFPFDPWVRFMHWTHRYYPYGPGWLWFSLIPSWLGMGKFVLTLGLFKLLFGVAYGASCWAIDRILRQLDPKYQTWGLVFFAFNPLILIESLLSPHNEIVMLCLTLMAIYLLVKRSIFASILLIFAATSIKYLSGLFLPIFWFRKKMDSSFLHVFFWLWLLLLIPLVLIRESYSWYFVPLVGLASLVYRSKLPKIFMIGISAGMLARYIPFLALGEYSSLVTTLTFISMGIGLGLFWSIAAVGRNKLIG